MWGRHPRAHRGLAEWFSGHQHDTIGIDIPEEKLAMTNPPPNRMIYPIYEDDTARSLLHDLGVNLPDEADHGGRWDEQCLQCRRELRVAIAVVKKRKLFYHRDGKIELVPHPKYADPDDFARYVEAIVAMANYWNDVREEIAANAHTTES